MGGVEGTVSGRTKGLLSGSTVAETARRGISITRWGSLFASTGRIFQQDDTVWLRRGRFTLFAGQWRHVAQFHARRPGLFFVAGIQSWRAYPARVPSKAAIMSWKISRPRMIHNGRKTTPDGFFLSAIYPFSFLAVYTLVSFRFVSRVDPMQKCFSLRAFFYAITSLVHTYVTELSF